MCTARGPAVKKPRSLAVTQAGNSTWPGHVETDGSK